MKAETKKVAVVVLIAVTLCFLHAVLKMWLFDNGGQELQNENKRLLEQVDSLKGEIGQRDLLIEELGKTTVEIKERIVYIKVKNDEKVDSVRALPIDSAVEFFADKISKEADTRR